MRRLRLLIAAGALSALGCGTYLQAVAREQWVLQGGRQLMVFGGPGDSTYLGCLNCSHGSRDSVFTGGGTYNGDYMGALVVNPGSVFVSPSSDYSSCNLFATHPPIVVDEQGASYGRLTINQGLAGGPTMDQLRQWIVTVCQDNGLAPAS